MIVASFEITDKAGKPDLNGVVDREDRESGKHYDMFRRRAEAGQCFNQPYLGTREFPASFTWTGKSEIPPSPLRGEHDLGWMLHDIDFESGMEPRFFHAVMRDGVVEVPPFDSKEVRR